MTSEQRLYLAGVGIVSPLGKNTPQTVAAVHAGISAYAESEFDNWAGEPIIMTAVPEDVFAGFTGVIDEGTFYCDLYDRTIKMAIIALRESISKHDFEGVVPVVLAMPEPLQGVDQISPKLLAVNIANQADFPIESKYMRTIRTGRAGGIEALDSAFRYVYELGFEFVIVGGSDSYFDYSVLSALDDERRLLASGEMDGFAPGEAACFLLLTANKSQALVKNNSVVAFCKPGISEEPGHMRSSEPYLGDGLSQAFKRALSSVNNPETTQIYASMNGERFWGKEYGVASMRNDKKLHESVEVKHPAEFFGDIGAATGSMLVAMAAYDLFKHKDQNTALIYASSDGSARAAVVLQKECAHDYKKDGQV